MQGPTWVALSMHTPMHKQHFCETGVYLAQDVVGIESAWTLVSLYALSIVQVCVQTLCGTCLHGD